MHVQRVRGVEFLRRVRDLAAALFSTRCFIHGIRIGARLLIHARPAAAAELNRTRRDDALGAAGRLTVGVQSLLT